MYADKKKDALVAQETCGNRKMISQILNATFKFQGGVDHGIACPAGLEVIASYLAGLFDIFISLHI